MANTRIAGIADVTMDGVVVQLRGELEYGLSGVERTTLVGQDGSADYGEMPKQGYIAGKFADLGDVDVAIFNAAVDVQVVARLANGKMISGSNMWQVGAPPEVSTTDGTFPLRFESMLVETI